MADTVPPVFPSGQRGRSENRADYQQAFLRRVHQLLQLGYLSLKVEDYQCSEEDDITGDLCRHMKHLTEKEPIERWMGFYSVHDQDPSNDVLSMATGKVRKGKRRPKIDIRLVCKASLPNPSYCVEAKRLYRSDSVSEYVDDEGVGAFICGDYAKDDPWGGMIGYVQSESVHSWLPKIEAKLSSHTSVQKSASGKAWDKAAFPKGPSVCFSSKHMRDSGQEIALFHVLFSFSGKA